MAKEPVIFTTNQVSELASRVLENYRRKTSEGEEDKAKASPKRYVISLAGVPGAGKSTFSEAVVKELNKTIKSAILPQDGFHLYRTELQKLPNPEEAIIRRGAPFTFNAKAFVDLVSKLNHPQYLVEVLKAPSFDHRLKDPVEDDIHIEADTKIVIVEGNYVSLEDEYWNEISSYVDETWFVKTDMDVVRERIVKRHLAAGIARNEKEAIERADGSDLVNAHYILKHSKPTDVIIVTE
ncbi:pantothenate kinase-like protein [Scheffersomyces xylosifermentans]|uniref:pantothenate kinase-like protein n=1 Tax=Scheffersomyces xylosifermentans TaxID=1304137 RepID=UPI00315D9F4D